jgi:hypothetical protein
MRSAILVAALAGAIVTLPVFAQAPPPPIYVRGTVEKLDGEALTVKSREGQAVSIKLGGDVPVSATVKRSLSDIKPGDFIASTSVKESDGKLHALEIHIFTEAQKKIVPQLQVPYDLAPQSIMTNAIVEGVAGAPQGQVLKLTYKDQQTELVVPPNTPIVAAVPGDKSLLKPGAAVFITARKQPDGMLSAVRITAEKDGVKPPM